MDRPGPIETFAIGTVLQLTLNNDHANYQPTTGICLQNVRQGWILWEASELRKLSRTESPIESFPEDFVQINSKHKSGNLGVASCLKVLSRSQYNSWRENNERPHQQKPENSNVSRTQCIQNCKFARGLDSQN